MSVQQLESLIQKLKSVPVDPTASIGRKRGAMEKAAFRLDSDWLPSRLRPTAFPRNGLPPPVRIPGATCSTFMAAAT